MPTTIKHYFLRAAVWLETQVDRTTWRLRQARGIGPVKILPYMGYATQQAIYLHGRAIERYKVQAASLQDSRWRNVLNAIRRFNSQDLPNARLNVCFNDQVYPVTASAEGHFGAMIPLSSPLPPGQHDIALELVDYDGLPGAHSAVPVLVPDPQAQFAFISDLDDSVIRTDVDNKLRMLFNTVAYNAHTRQTFPGVPSFYRALEQGTGQALNPIFYVSTSPWNIYDMLTEFMTVRGIPHGPLFLMDLGLTQDHFIRGDPLEHKLVRIRMLMDRFPHLPFIFKGDNSEEDPHTYLQIMREYPGRVPACYIRDLYAGAHDARLEPVLKHAREAGSEMLLVTNTLQAAQHAAAQGFIAADSLPEIEAACAGH